MPRSPSKPEGEGFVSRWTKVIAQAGAEPGRPMTAGAGTVENNEPELPRKGQRWMTLDGAKTCRVMSAPVEDYVMARYPGAAPWLMHINDWHQQFKRCDK